MKLWIIPIMLLLLISNVLAAAPTSTAYITPTLPGDNDTLIGSCTGNDADLDSLTIGYEWYNGASLFSSGYYGVDWVYNSTFSGASGGSAPTIADFNEDGYPEMITGTLGTDVGGYVQSTLDGHIWNGNSWVHSYGVVDGTGVFDAYSKPALAHMEGKWTLFVGDANEPFAVTGLPREDVNSFEYNGTSWVRNESLSVGLPSTLYLRIAMYDFNGDGTPEFFSSGDVDGTGSTTTISAYSWNGTSWNRNTTYENGIPEIAFGYHTFDFEDFDHDGNIEMILRTNFFSNYPTAYEWDGATWSRDARADPGFTSNGFSPAFYDLNNDSIYEMNVNVGSTYEFIENSLPSGTAIEVNISNTSTSIGENWTISCQSYDGTSYSTVRTDTVTIQGPCTPDWSCDGYTTPTCLINDTSTAACNSTTDNNACGTSYTGNYTEFENQTGVCDYCTPSWSCSLWDTCVEPATSVNCTTAVDANSCYAKQDS
jgi:hypothetical protein